MKNKFTIPLLKKLRKRFRWLIKKRKFYPPKTISEYYEQFGVLFQNGKYVVTDAELLNRAFTKAWENRDYEIDKFWTRAAYFWGFIVLIFGGYISILTAEYGKHALELKLDLYLLLLGFVFSIAWYLVILGSKFWQRNWEAHIDHLEDFISGSLYKTIYYSGRRVYSVSKLNEVLSLVVITAWVGLLIQHLSQNYSFLALPIDLTATLAVSLSIIFSVVLLFGYSLGEYKTKKNHFFGRWDKPFKKKMEKSLK